MGFVENLTVTRDEVNLQCINEWKPHLWWGLELSGLHEPLAHEGSKTRWGKVYLRKKNWMVEVAWHSGIVVRGKGRKFGWEEKLACSSFHY